MAFFLNLFVFYGHTVFQHKSQPSRPTLVSDADVPKRDLQRGAPGRKSNTNLLYNIQTYYYLS
jgi:hypothetical protein